MLRRQRSTSTDFSNLASFVERAAIEPVQEPPCRHLWCPVLTRGIWPCRRVATAITTSVQPSELRSSPPTTAETSGQYAPQPDVSSFWRRLPGGRPQPRLPCPALTYFENDRAET